MDVEPSKSIKAINRDAVHKICSGQVVLNLAVAVKELVENSLDAGATVVEIKLKEYGSELIEVIDNGSGVEPSNFQGLTLKHHTSKLQDFSDLMSVETFGFRGEALSSLCSLSNLMVTTRHVSCNCGTRLVFDHNGKITSSTSVARQVGTTVSVENIFSTLPVRHKEFHRNLKREFGKMSQILYAYCLISTGVKITCTNHTKKGGRMTVVSTQGCKTVRENVACVFGTKQLASLLELQTVRPDQEVLEQLGIGELSETLFELEGLVSSCAHGQGRSSNDRQFYYVNSRPCEPSKVIKAVNEVFHQYNMNQQPFVYLNIRSTRDSIDVNITPDKRQVFMEHEKLLVATVKSSLQAMYEKISSSFTVNNVLSSPKQSITISPNTSQSSPAAILSQWRHSSSIKRPVSEHTMERLPKQAKMDVMFAKKDKGTAVLNQSAHRKSVPVNQDEDSKLPASCYNNNEESRKSDVKDIVITQNITSSNSTYESDSTEQVGDEILQSTSNNKDCNNKCVTYSEDTSQKSEFGQCTSSSDTDSFVNKSHVSGTSTLPTPDNFINSSQSSTISDLETAVPVVNDSLGMFTKSSCVIDIPQSCTDDDTSSTSLLHNDLHKVELVQDMNVQYDSTPNLEHKKQIVEISLTMEDLREQVLQSQKKSVTSDKKVRFRAVIDPTKNSQAEQELSREISKEMFAKMEVIGQFNLGFIIARLDSDLFIVDQHATDEKYNFETLQRTTTISSQKLVIPQPLELTAVNEAILMDNIEIFKANGFEFQIDENAPTTAKVKLTSIPMSRNWTFGPEDIDELLFMLQDAPNTLCRPSRVRAMFASRACRKSVMIGSALSTSEMKRLLTHMGEMEQPWNCPHGRPTMRHLINLDFL